RSDGEAEVETEGDCERTRQRGSSEGLRPANSANNDHQYFVQGLACVNLKWLSVVENKPRALKGVEGLTKLTFFVIVVSGVKIKHACYCSDIVYAHHLFDKISKSNLLRKWEADEEYSTACLAVVERRRTNGIVVEDEEAMCESSERLMRSISAAAWQLLRRRRRNGIVVEDEEAMYKSR
ncbi:hypothetical protein Dimus_010828, partial [Dionaea muscipula]